MSLHQVEKFPFLSEHSGPGGMYIQIKCSRCGTTDSRRQKFKEMSIGDVHIPYWRHKGWTFKKHEAICLKCRDAEHRKKKEPLKVTIGDAIAAKLSVVPEPKPEPPPPVVEPPAEPKPNLEIVSKQPLSKEEILAKMRQRKKEPEPTPKKFELRPGLQFTAEREAFDNEIFEVLEAHGGWMSSGEIQEKVGGGLQQIRNGLQRLEEAGAAEIRGQTRHTRYRLKPMARPKKVALPQPVAAPPEVTDKRQMRYHPPEFKRYVVETAHGLKRTEREEFFRSVEIHTGTVPYFKREYIEGKLGTLDVPIRIIPLHNKLEPLRTRKFTDNYKKAVVQEAAKAKDVNEYLRLRGLTKLNLQRWQRDFAPNQPPPKTSTQPMDTKLQFRLYDLLREQCPQGRYKNGWSDDIIARELKIDRREVEHIRKEVYAPTADPVVEELRGDLLSLKRKFDEDMKGLRELEKSIRDDFQRQYDGLSDRLAAIEAR